MATAQKLVECKWEDLGPVGEQVICRKLLSMAKDCILLLWLCASWALLKLVGVMLSGSAFTVIPCGQRILHFLSLISVSNLT